ncbi:MAG: polyribonucleotide nucleotidyltransferase [Flavobacteriales bacterium]|jgi:polyribonucleotide nucleotidyltransferase|nr:polyribonucleotide nucleotidyltransferase [Flavobacteriales bacterium]
MMNVKEKTLTLPDGREIKIETGKLARQAHGSVMVSMGKMRMLATVVSNHSPKEGIDFLPLTVDYREKFAADGRFPGGFFKREARPSTNEILTMRLVDRVLRPLFPKNYHHETQIMIQLMSHDPEVMPDAFAGLAASACLAVSDIPFSGPISEVRVGRLNGEFVINPSLEDLENCDIDLMVGASKESVVMVEGEMKEVSEDEMIEAIAFAHEAIKAQCDLQLALAEEVESAYPKREVAVVEINEEIYNKVKEEAYQKLYDIAKKGTAKHERSAAFALILDEILEGLSEEEKEENGGLYKSYFYKIQKDAVRNLVLDEGIRLDGRSTTDIRPIACEVDLLPSTHGSGLFTRGETQALSTVTLGTSLDDNIVDDVSLVGKEKFYLHYNFPPFSTGEARPIRGTSRREIGHGNLAQRALKDMITDDCKYTVRVVSEVLESNGSSSMATVCSGTMALMDAGVPMKAPVSGIAMGLITDPDTGKYAVLSDILGDEDFLGDMDFKVTGTDKGITACQMDIKIQGLTYEILSNALNQSKEGRLHILGKLTDTIDASRDNVKDHAPQMENMTIKKDFIGAVIGPGGKVIQELQAKTDTTITITEDGDFGKIEILGTNPEGMKAAIAKIEAITFEPNVGDIFDAKVVSIQDYGAFVEIAPGTQGLLHISEITWERLKSMEGVYNEGDDVRVKLLAIDAKTKKLKLSAKALLEKPEGYVERERKPRPQGDRNKRNDRRNDKK